jgi:hypothetical protein
MKTYIFKVSLESDKDAWYTFSPPLEHVGFAAWGRHKRKPSSISMQFFL